MLSRLKALLFSEKPSPNLTRAQIALLSQFNRARSLKVSGWSEGWEAVLNETLQRTLEQFVRAGLIVAASGEDYANALNITQLKAILKKTGLPVSGKKSMLVDRVVSSGYDVVRDYPHGSLWKCSSAGLLYATPYLAAEEQRKQEAIVGAKEALAHGDLSSAAKIAAEYQANDVFGSISLSGECRADGISVSINEAQSPSARAKDILIGLKIYQDAKKQRPVPFNHVPAEIFDEAADACTWSCLLLGKGERRREAERVALELWNWRSNKDNLARYKKSEADGIILGVEILCGDECPIGSAHKGKVYPTSEAPELPLVGCTREPCCACTYIARVKGFDD